MHRVDTPRHLTRVDTETTSAWEGDRVSGMVKLVATGWATGSIPAPPVPMPDPSPPTPAPNPGPLPPAPDPAPPVPAPAPPAPPSI